MSIKDIIDDFSNGQGDNDWLWRNRPYKGQPHTDNGERGKTEVKGVTFRDIRDCFILACFDAANDQLTEEKKDRWRKDRMTLNEIYELDLNKLDPIAWAQNLSVRIEKMMGIYPNIQAIDVAPRLKNEPGDKCPVCGADEVEENSPRTKYACGSSDYDGRPDTFKQAANCKRSTP